MLKYVSNPCVSAPPSRKSAGRDMFNHDMSGNQSSSPPYSTYKTGGWVDPTAIFDNHFKVAYSHWKRICNFSVLCLYLDK